MNLPRNILVPIDVEDAAAQVLDYAVALATKLDAKLHVLHVVAWPLLGAEVPIAVSETAKLAATAINTRTKPSTE